MTEVEDWKRQMLSLADSHTEELLMYNKEIRELKDEIVRLKTSNQLLREAQQVNWQGG